MKRILLIMGLLLLTNVEADVIDECLKENKAKSCYEAGVLCSNKNRMEEALKVSDFKGFCKKSNEKLITQRI